MKYKIEPSSRRFVACHTRTATNVLHQVLSSKQLFFTVGKTMGKKAEKPNKQTFQHSCQNIPNIWHYLSPVRKLHLLGVCFGCVPNTHLSYFSNLPSLTVSLYNVAWWLPPSPPSIAQFPEVQSHKQALSHPWKEVLLIWSQSPSRWDRLHIKHCIQCWAQCTLCTVWYTVYTVHRAHF